ncbi:MAG: glycosyltransferase involved in cell wall biosynthesis [Myxococcota bacterium]
MALEGRRILIDATGASIGGGYTYLVNVIPRLCALAPDAKIRLMLRHDRLVEVLTPVAEGHDNFEIVSLPSVGVGARLFHTFFSMPGLAAEWKADVFFSVGEVAPLRMPCASIASFRNANVFTNDVPPTTFRDRIRFMVLWGIARLAAWSCDRIMFVSHDSARWIGDSISMPERKRAVIHHGIDAAQWAAAEPYQGHSRPYILSVSSIYHYKNYVRLIEAYHRVAARAPSGATPDLIIIGDDYDVEYRAEMEAARASTGELASQIHILGSVPYEEVKSYCAGAELFVFPSYLETFGHPLLEAMAAGVPLVASGIDSFREVAGDAALFAAYDDVGAIADAMEEALRPEVAADLVRRGNERITHFTWDASVAELVKLFEAVVHEREAT